MWVVEKTALVMDQDRIMGVERAIWQLMKIAIFQVFWIKVSKWDHIASSEKNRIVFFLLILFFSF